MNSAARKVFILALVCFAARSQAGPTDLKFSFMPGRPPPGYMPVSASTVYHAERGYGFERGAKITAVGRRADDPLHSGFCTSDRPFFFSVAVPEGNYRVTVTLGDAGGESTTTVKAELRRLMLEHVHTARGQFTSRSFVVNVRVPAISTGGGVRLKERERTTEAWDWDDKLTLEFNDARPCLCALEISRTDTAPTIFLLGDSTVCDQPLEPWNSWGQMLPRFFGPGIAIANHAESGESLRSSLSAHRLEKVLSVMKPGDWLFIQYGHNDMKEDGPGVGALTTFKADLKDYVASAHQHLGNVVLVTPMNRESFNSEGVITNTLGDYPLAVRQTAAEEHVALIDLNAMSKTLYEALGQQNMDKVFQDGTHHKSFGSYELARCIVVVIMENQLPITMYLAPDAAPFDPQHPDPPDTFHIPPSPNHPATKPQGN